jgi:DNA repair protein RecO (recombination protein O)
MALFIAEILSKVTNEEQANSNLFVFLQNALNNLDNPKQEIKNYHISFLADLSFYLGFRPAQSRGSSEYFDMSEGVFVKSQPDHPYYFDQDLSALLTTLLKQHDISCGKDQRLALLEGLLTYYRLQYDGFGEVKSLDVIKTLF